MPASHKSSNELQTFLTLLSKTDFCHTASQQLQFGCVTGSVSVNWNALWVLMDSCITSEAQSSSLNLPTGCTASDRRAAATEGLCS